jgi:hypothetical protein
VDPDELTCRNAPKRTIVIIGPLTSNLITFHKISTSAPSESRRKKEHIINKWEEKEEDKKNKKFPYFYGPWSNPFSKQS